MKTFIPIVLLVVSTFTGPVSCFAQQSNAATNGRDTIIVIGSGLEAEMNNDIKSHVAKFVGDANGGDRIHVYSGSEHSPVATISIPEATGRARLRERSLISSFRKLSEFLEQNTGSENPGQFGFYRLPDTYWSVSDGKRDCQFVFIGDPVFHEPRRNGFWSFQGGRFPSDNSVISADSTSPFINSQKKPVPHSVDVSIVPISSDWGDSKLHREHIIRFLRLAMQQQLGGRMDRVTDKMSVALDPSTTSIFRQEVQPDDHPMVGIWTIKNGVHQLITPGSARNESDRVSPSPVEGNSGSNRQPRNASRSTTGSTEETSLAPGESSPSFAGVDSTHDSSGSRPNETEVTADRETSDSGTSTSPEEVSEHTQPGLSLGQVGFEQVVDEPLTTDGMGAAPVQEQDDTSREEIATQRRTMKPSIDQIDASKGAGAESHGDVEKLRTQNSDLQEEPELANNRLNELEDMSSREASAIANGTEPSVIKTKSPVLSQSKVNTYREKLAALEPEIQEGVRRIFATRPDAIVILHQAYTKCSHADVDLVIEGPRGSLSKNSDPVSFGEVIQTKRGSIPNGSISLREVQTLFAIWPEDVNEVSLASNVVFSHFPVRTKLIAIANDAWAESTFDQQKQLDSATSRKSSSAWERIGLVSMFQTGFSIYE
ncbi:hypothetical protein [Mariniblastus fucicola]|uniref:Uncharacterized protein n=1 Tax=Mariniblastus fucicola TaxID=980251 RepID=A0A5B9P3Q4_9BACT|nr:hypothetical protein [Mariniblastus fucicola]QEG21038.1 hypothetical protein MFFC18_08900 [Mariniblastus fucicola]